VQQQQQNLRLMMRWSMEMLPKGHHCCLAIRRRQQQQQRQMVFLSSSSSSSVPFYGAPRPIISNENHSTLLYSSVFRRVLNTGLVLQRVVGGASSSDAAAASLDRVWMTCHCAAVAAKDPTRADAVARVGELTGGHALQKLLRDVMLPDATGRSILRDRPIVSKATIPYHRLMEEARAMQISDGSNNTNSGSSEKLADSERTDLTFGQAYGLFLLDHGFDPDKRDEVAFIPAEDLAYVMTRYRQNHDFWHTLTGLPTTVAGEIGLKWLELFQTGLPLAALSCTAGTVLSLPERSDRAYVMHAYWPWALDAHRNLTTNLMNVYYEQEWDTPLMKLRHRLNLKPAPQLPPPPMTTDVSQS
jgi:ubiquinone biosynthesis protein COQ4